jgi:heme exporter protein B
LSWADETAAVFGKEMREESRNRYAAYAMMLFCLVALAVVGFATHGAAADARVNAALLWITLFFAAMTGLGRSFIKEEERGAMELLRCAASPGPLFAGKALFNLALLALCAAALTPLFCLLLNVKPGNPTLLAAVVATASLPIAAVSTLVSALVSQSRARGMLFPALAFPVLVVPFSVAVRATAAALRGDSFVAQSMPLVFLGAFAVVAFTVSLFLFEFVFED